MSGEDAPRPCLENLIVPEIKTNKQTNATEQWHARSYSRPSVGWITETLGRQFPCMPAWDLVVPLGLVYKSWQHGRPNKAAAASSGHQQPLCIGWAPGGWAVSTCLWCEPSGVAGRAGRRGTPVSFVLGPRSSTMVCRRWFVHFEHVHVSSLSH